MIFLWNVIERFLPMFIQFFAYLVITSSMDPVLVGILGVINLFIALSQVIIDGGMSSIIIRDQAKDKMLLNSVFYLAVTISIISYFIVVLLSFYLELYLEIKDLPNYIIYAGLVLPISGLAVVSRSILVISNEYKTMTRMAVSSSVISFIFAYIMNSYGFGVWSIITLSLLFNVLNSFQIIHKSKFQPSNKVNFNALFQQRMYLINVLCTNLIDGIFRNIYSLVVVKFFNLYSAGLYNQSQRFADLSSYNLYAVIYRFVFTKLSAELDITKRRIKFIHYTKLVLLCTTPCYLLVYIYSDVIVDLLLGDNWSGMITVFSFLMLSGLIYPTKAVFSAYFHSIGHAKKVLIIEMIYKALLLINIFIALDYNIEFMACGVLISSLIVLMLMLFLCVKDIYYKPEEVRL